MTERLIAISTIVMIIGVGVWWRWYRYYPVSTATNAASVREVSSDPTILAAGDIADCDSSGDEATAALLDGSETLILTLGDHVYPSGGLARFRDCYDSSWGRYKDRTRPVPGNHDYTDPQAAGYFAYFGSAAGDPSKGYYSYDVGAWHVVALNTNCGAVGGCGPGSAQLAWLEADVRAHPAACTLAAMHHPRFSSGQHGDDDGLDPLWKALVDSGVDIVLAGHDHDYERFGPMDRNGRLAAGGTRLFVVGTGGKSHYVMPRTHPASQTRDNTSFGVLQLTLHPTGYDWAFEPATGSFHDAGTGTCS